MMLTHEAITADPTTPWGAISTVAVAVGFVAQIILQLLARAAAKKKDTEDKVATAAIATKVDAVKTQAVQTAVKVQKVQAISDKLETSSNQTADKLDALAEDTKMVKKTGEAVHLLVNSAMSAALKAAAVALRRLADMTKEPGDIEAANIAEAGFQEHERKQRLVDAVHSIMTASVVPEPKPATWPQAESKE